MTKITWTVQNTEAKDSEQDANLAGKEFRVAGCECGNYSFTHEGVRYGTDCRRDSTRLFAQGHDASLKSLLIKAGSLRVATVTERYFVGTGEVKVYEQTEVSDHPEPKTRIRTVKVPQFELKSREVAPAQVAGKFGFGHMVESGVARAQAKSAKRTAAAKAKASRKAAKQAEPTYTTVKRGRWTYDLREVTLDGDQANVAYVAKSGEVKHEVVPVSALA